MEDELVQDVLVDRDRYIKAVSDRIRGIASELVLEARAPLDFHNTLQREVAELGSAFGFMGVREYPVYNTEIGVEGLADVAWLARRRLASVFEIDSTPRAKSVQKLLALDAPFRFWVYYGRPHYLSMVRSVDRRDQIEIIRLRNVWF
ncbi:MAG: hypothetical protein ABSG92_07390 [Conexivisphaerales archaeon]